MYQGLVEPFLTYAHDFVLNAPNPPLPDHVFADSNSQSCWRTIHPHLQPTGEPQGRRSGPHGGPVASHSTPNAGAAAVDEADRTGELSFEDHARPGALPPSLAGYSVPAMTLNASSTCQRLTPGLRVPPLPNEQVRHQRSGEAARGLGELDVPRDLGVEHGRVSGAARRLSQLANGDGNGIGNGNGSRSPTGPHRATDMVGEISTASFPSTTAGGSQITVDSQATAGRVDSPLGRGGPVSMSSTVHPAVARKEYADVDDSRGGYSLGRFNPINGRGSPLEPTGVKSPKPQDVSFGSFFDSFHTHHSANSTTPATAANTNGDPLPHRDQERGHTDMHTRNDAARTSASTAIPPAVPNGTPSADDDTQLSIRMPSALHAPKPNIPLGQAPTAGGMSLRGIGPLRAHDVPGESRINRPRGGLEAPTKAAAPAVVIDLTDDEQAVDMGHVDAGRLHPFDGPETTAAAAGIGRDGVSQQATASATAAATGVVVTKDLSTAMDHSQEIPGAGDTMSSTSSDGEDSYVPASTLASQAGSAGGNSGVNGNGQRVTGIHIDKLALIPDAKQVISMQPQTLTVNLIVGVLRIFAPRTILQSTFGGRQRTTQCAQVKVGDDTMPGFEIIFWIGSEDGHMTTARQRRLQQQQRQNGRTLDETDMRTAYYQIRPRDVVLLQNVGLKVWNGRVTGYTLHGGLTRMRILYRAPEVERETGHEGDYAAWMIGASSMARKASGEPEDSRLYHARKVWKWVVNYVLPGSVGSGSGPGAAHPSTTNASRAAASATNMGQNGTRIGHMQSLDEPPPDTQ